MAARIKKNDAVNDIENRNMAVFNDSVANKGLNVTKGPRTFGPLTKTRVPLTSLNRNALKDKENRDQTISKPFDNQQRAVKVPFVVHEDEASRETKKKVPNVDPEGVRKPLMTLDLNKDNLKESPMVLDISSGSDILKVSEVEEKEQEVEEEDQEYAREIYTYLKEAECERRPKVTYMKKQPDITHGMRSILVDWLVEVSEEYKLQPETLFLAVAYIDRFLSSMSVLRSKLQLVGTASMLVAAKFEEIYPPEIDEFVYITDETYTKKQVLRMEQVILRVLTFDLAVPTVHYFLRRYSHVGRLMNQCKNLAMYLTELTLLEADPFLRFLPSVLAGSAICIACHTLEMEPWNENLIEESGYVMEDFSECISLLYKSYCNASKYPQQAIREKYRSTKYLCVADILPPLTLPI